MITRRSSTALRAGRSVLQISGEARSHPARPGSAATSLAAMAILIAVVMAACTSAPSGQGGRAPAQVDSLVGLWQSQDPPDADAAFAFDQVKFEFLNDGTVTVMYFESATTSEYEVQGDQVRMIGKDGSTLLYGITGEELLLRQGWGPTRLARGSAMPPDGEFNE